MISIGLTSVTFRNLDASEVINYAKRSGIKSIEWGSDIHAPIDDIENLKKIKAEMEQNDLFVSSYGSYYRLGKENYFDDASSLINAADILGAKVIRIWTGSKPFDEVTEAEYDKSIEEMKYLCKLAEISGIDIACEYHYGTLTDSREHSLKVVNDVNADNFGMYYQYDPRFDMDENINTLKEFLPILKNVHVFNIDEEYMHYPICEHGGIKMWSDFVKIIKDSNTDVCLLFEFLPEQSLECLTKECETMKALVKHEEIIEI